MTPTLEFRSLEQPGLVPTCISPNGQIIAGAGYYYATGTTHVVGIIPFRLRLKDYPYGFQCLCLPNPAEAVGINDDGIAAVVEHPDQYPAKNRRAGRWNEAVRSYRPFFDDSVAFGSRPTFDSAVAYGIMPNGDIGGGVWISEPGFADIAVWGEKTRKAHPAGEVARRSFPWHGSVYPDWLRDGRLMVLAFEHGYSEKPRYHFFIGDDSNIRPMTIRRCDLKDLPRKFDEVFLFRNRFDLNLLVVRVDDTYFANSGMRCDVWEECGRLEWTAVTRQGIAFAYETDQLGGVRRAMFVDLLSEDRTPRPVNEILPTGVPPIMSIRDVDAAGQRAVGYADQGGYALGAVFEIK